MVEIATEPRLNKGKIINQETMINKNNKDKSPYGKDESNNLNEHNKGTSNNDNDKKTTSLQVHVAMMTTVWISGRAL